MSTISVLYQCQPPRGITRQTVNSRQPSPCGCGSTYLEYPANWRRCTFRQLLKRFLFKQSYPDIIYWHSGPCSGCATYATVKIYWLVGWLIDWLIDWLIFLGDRCPEGGNIRSCAHPRVAVPSHRATRLSWWSSQARLGSPGLAWRNKSVWGQVRWPKPEMRWLTSWYRPRLDG